MHVLIATGTIIAFQLSKLTIQRIRNSITIFNNLINIFKMFGPIIGFENGGTKKNTHTKTDCNFITGAGSRVSDYGNDEIQFKIIIIHIDCHKMHSNDPAGQNNQPMYFSCPFNAIVIDFLFVFAVN